MPYPIIDLFAGPGGLAEGFSSLVDEQGHRMFKIKLSIEKEQHEHETLTLRSFLRQFEPDEFPEAYYDFIHGLITITDLYDKYPGQYAEAKNEAWRATLGKNSEEEIDTRIAESIDNTRDWVLIGGPPCQAYSLVGRSRVGGVHEDDHRVHLYKEYLRIIARHQPAVFVMENVKGLLSAELNKEKIFPRILEDLQHPDTVFPEFPSAQYRIYSLVKENVRKDSDYLIKAEDYGIPQKRHRVILLGVRNDIPGRPSILHAVKKVSLKSVINDFPRIRSGIYRSFSHTELVAEGGATRLKRKYIQVTDSNEEWLKTIKINLESLAKTLSQPIKKSDEIQWMPDSTGAEFIPTDKQVLDSKHPLFNWYVDKKMKGVLHHHSRSHMSQDLKRYLFASVYTGLFNKFPRMEDYKKYGDDLLPDHANAESGKFNDRFRVQLPDEPATTVTSHISKDGHYFIHYDPTQCRSLTVREAARIQTFPDNYYFCGSRTQQFHQVGNAVPPLLAYKISRIVADLLLEIPEDHQLELFDNERN